MTGLLQATGMSKSYDGVEVLTNASIELGVGRVRSIVGENGAGKSTLTRIISGVTSPDHGSVILDGESVTFSGPAAAAARGIVMVHQELALVQGLSIADNIMLTRPPDGPWRVRGSHAERRFVVAALARVGLRLSPSTLVGELSVAQAYLVEIAKALVLRARVIIFDEPTAALPGDASAMILNQIRELRDSGCSIVFISHRLGEVLEISDDITVMRDGRIVADFSETVSEEDLIRLMVDRPVGLYRAQRHPRGQSVVLEVSALTTRRITDVSFVARSGEIVGLAGLVGAGRTETALAISGADHVRSGSVRLLDRDITGQSVAKVRHAGVVLVPEDRKQQGIVQGLSVHENLHIGNLGGFLRFGLLRNKELRRASDNSKTMFDIRLRSLYQPIETLSGGNQQKAILARAMEIKPKVLILDEPTRGVDVRAKDEIHKLVLQLAAQGTAVILISSELEEVLALSHRVVVFAEGWVTGQLDNTETVSPEAVMRLATPKKDLKGVPLV
jgi:ABC-type sugar transport system ATPase subunit